MSDRTSVVANASPEYAIADLLVPGGSNAPAHGAPRIWVHLWMEVYRMANGDPHLRFSALSRSSWTADGA